MARFSHPCDCARKACAIARQPIRFTSICCETLSDRTRTKLRGGHGGIVDQDIGRPEAHGKLLYHRHSRPAAAQIGNRRNDIMIAQCFNSRRAACRIAVYQRHTRPAARNPAAIARPKPRAPPVSSTVLPFNPNQSAVMPALFPLQILGGQIR